MHDIAHNVSESDVFLDLKGRPINVSRFFSVAGLKLKPKCDLYDDDTSDITLTYRTPDRKFACEVIMGTSKDGESKIIEIDEFEAKNCGTLVFAKILHFAKMIGAEKIDLRAVDIGGFFWARLGFLPEEDEFNKVSRDLYQRFLGSSKDPDEEISCNNYDDFRAIAKSEYGKKLLICSSWNGQLDLRDPDQMRFCKEYIVDRLTRDR